MKKIVCFLLVFLLSISVAGCAVSAPGFTETSTVSEENVTGNFYKINGSMRDIGDYLETEELFLMDYCDNQLPATGISEDRVYVYDSGDLTAEILENREGTLIIERCIGLVTDKTNGDGIILNCGDDGYYIAYRGESCETLNLYDGTVLLSYMVYDPNNNYIDDIMERYDFVICREYED